MNSFQKIIVLIIVSAQYLFDRVCRLIFGPTIFSENKIDGKVVIVTGANSGIGKESALEFAKRGAKVVLACRNLVEGKKAQDEITRRAMAHPGQVELMELDLADLASVRRFAQNANKKFPKIDILVNNAGFYDGGSLKKTKDGFERHIGVNHLGHFLLTHLLLDNIKAAQSSRIVTVASTAQRFADLRINDLNMEKTSLGFENMLPYINSKFANSLFTQELGAKLRNTSVTTYACCPGIVTTAFYRNLPRAKQIRAGIFNYFFGVDAAKGAETILYCALAKEIEHDTGKFYRFVSFNSYYNRHISQNKQLGLELWEESEKLVGLKKR